MPEEEKIVPNRAGQIARLRDRLAGNEAFGRLRRGCDLQRTGLDQVARLMSGAESPSAFRKRWDDYAADVRDVTAILAQLRRDGWADAFDELARTLRDPCYVIEGETIPLHETAPLTLLIIDFPRTAEMIRWVRSIHPYGVTATGNEWTRRMCQLFPSLASCIACAGVWEPEHPGRSLLKAHLLDVLQPLLPQIRTLPRGTASLQIERHTCHTQFAITDAHLRDFEIRLGFAIPEEQGAVLARFSREQQTLLSTWQCRVPRLTAELGNNTGLAFGFHPEAGHSQFPQGGGFFPSAGCQSGYGAVALYHPKTEDLRSYLSRFHKVDCWGGCEDETTVGKDFAFLLDKYCG